MFLLSVDRCPHVGWSAWLLGKNKESEIHVGRTLQHWQPQAISPTEAHISHAERLVNSQLLDTVVAQSSITTAGKQESLRLSSVLSCTGRDAASVPGTRAVCNKQRHGAGPVWGLQPYKPEQEEGQRKLTLKCQMTCSCLQTLKTKL